MAATRSFALNLSIIIFATLFLILGSVATPVSALSVSTSVTPSNVVLKPCEQNTFSIVATGLPEAQRNLEVRVNGLPSFVQYFAPAQVSVSNDRAELQVVVLYPCSADTAGVYPFSVSFYHNSEQVAAASAKLSTATRTGLSVELEQTDISPQGGEYACACDSGHFSLRIRNAGSTTESGNVILSAPFPASISGSTYSLNPGENEDKQITVDVPCNATSGTYPMSVTLLRPGLSGRSSGFSSPVLSKPLVLSVGRCYASHIEGPTYISACLGESLRTQYAVYNDGEQQSEYRLSTNLGRTVPLNVEVDKHSGQLFELVIPARMMNLTGRYKFTIGAEWNEDSYYLPVIMDVAFCNGITQERMLGDFSDVLGGFDLPRGTPRKFAVNIVNDNSYPWHNAVVEISGFGIVSQPFDLAVGENKSIELVLNTPSNFTTRNVNFAVTSEEGSDSAIIELRPGPTPLSAFFTAFAGRNLSDAEVALFAVALLIVLGIAYYFKVAGEKRASQDKELADALESILAKHG